MIVGFNTDIEFGGTVYHVQTEDKGPPAMVIMSLVYDRGTILASKRESYEDIASSGVDEKKVAERVGKQHRLICAAVKAGRIDELKEMTAKSASLRSAARKGVAATAETVSAQVPGPNVEVPLPQTAIQTPQPAELVPQIKGFPRAGHALKISIVEPEPPVDVIVSDFELETVIEDARIIEVEEEILPAEAVEVVSELSGRERPRNTKLKLELLGDPKFRGGDRQTVSIMLCRGTDRKVVAGAQIMVKVLGSAFRPVIFHARSDINGLARVHLQVPQFSAGRAALMVRALSEGEEVELRRLVSPG